MNKDVDNELKQKFLLPFFYKLDEIETTKAFSLKYFF